jgi:hypothetical protein
LRENGGVYSHAAVWAIAAAAKVRNAELAARLLHAMDPTGKDPERYWAEPYVLPGNVDGPASPWHGRGGWTWYTGAAAWLHRVVCEWVLGVRPEWDGLVVDPRLPPGLAGRPHDRPFRGATYEIEIERARTCRPACGPRSSSTGSSGGTLPPAPRPPASTTAGTLPLRSDHGERRPARVSKRWQPGGGARSISRSETAS